MVNPEVDRVFAGSVPQLYERFLVPLIFEPYAGELAARVERHRPTRVLEIAAGTGVVTRELARTLASGTEIVATDLNQPMLDQAAAVGTARPVVWRQADAMELPFPDERFDVAVCQFGVMFFPDKAKAFSEARRVLRSGGLLVFNVWDSIDHSEFADTVTNALAARFPQDPPRFLARTPHGYHDTAVIAQDLAQGGFTRRAQFTTIAARSKAASPDVPAIAYCQGTPLRNEIAARAPGGVADATNAAGAAIAERFGTGKVDGRIQAHIVAIER